MSDNRTGKEFWADKVHRLKGAGETRSVVAECRKHIPYPAAFREAAVAIRKDIRERRKQGEDTKGLMRDLYWWAVAENFYRHIEWSKIITESILHPTALSCLTGLMCPYSEIGYTHLELLNKTDAKWLVEAFGEPLSHGTAKDANPDLWQRAIEAFRIAKGRDEEHYWKSLGYDAPPFGTKGPGSRGQRTKPKGCLVIVAAFLLLACVVSLCALG